MDLSQAPNILRTYSKKEVNGCGNKKSLHIRQGLENENTSMRRLLAIYSICGIGGSENTPYYIDSIRSLIHQTLEPHYSNKYKIVISSCCSSEHTKQALINHFGDYIAYNWIDQRYPLSVTFNHTVDTCINTFGEFEDYLYVDSGISFWDPVGKRVCSNCKHEQGYDSLEKLLEVHKSGPYAITSAFPSNDDGSQWWGIKYRPGEDYIFPIGKATNMHCQLFSNEWRVSFGKILPDIFASNCMESLFTLMAASINKKVLMTQKVHLLHNHSMDGASIGFRKPMEDVYEMSDQHESAGLFYKKKKTMDQIYREGYELGFGFEECKPYWIHDPEKFNEEGFAKNPLLKHFFRASVYLDTNEFEYSKIENLFMPWRDK